MHLLCAYIRFHFFRYIFVQVLLDPDPNYPNVSFRPEFNKFWCGINTAFKNGVSGIWNGKWREIPPLMVIGGPTVWRHTPSPLKKTNGMTWLYIYSWRCQNSLGGRNEWMMLKIHRSDCFAQNKKLLIRTVVGKNRKMLRRRQYLNV